MPNVDLPIPNVEQSCSRPAIMTVIKDLQNILNIKDCIILYPGETKKVQQPTSNIDSDPNNKGDPMLSNTRHCFAEVTERLNKFGLSSMPGRTSEYETIFHDPDLMVLIRPMYAYSDVEITFKYTTDSRVDAFKWINDYYIKVGMLRQNSFLHGFDYHYTIPNIYLELLKEIYRCREEQGGFGDTFEEYFNAHSVPRFTYVTDQVGKNSILSVMDKQVRIQGVVDIEGIPEKPEKNENTWEASFMYKFTYVKPVACNFVYPISIHNQLLPEKYIKETNGEPDLDHVKKRFSNSMEALYYFEVPTMMDRYHDRKTEVIIPEIDDMYLGDAANHEVVFTALCLIDPEDPTLFLNLKELDDCVIDKRILEWLGEGEYEYLNKRRQSIFKITLFRNNKLADDRDIYVDKDLNVRSTIPVNIRLQHRVRLSLCVDIDNIMPQAIERVINNRKILPVLLLYLNEALKKDPNKRIKFLKNRISRKDFFEIYFKYKRQQDFKLDIKDFDDKINVYEKENKTISSMIPNLNPTEEEYQSDLLSKNDVDDEKTGVFSAKFTKEGDIEYSKYMNKEEGVKTYTAKERDQLTIHEILNKYYKVSTYLPDNLLKTQMTLIISAGKK